MHVEMTLLDIWGYVCSFNSMVQLLVYWLIALLKYFSLQLYTGTVNVNVNDFGTYTEVRSFESLGISAL